MKVYLETIDGLRKAIDIKRYHSGCVRARSILIHKFRHQGDLTYLDHREREYVKTDKKYRGRPVFLENLDYWDGGGGTWDPND